MRAHPRTHPLPEQRGHPPAEFCASGLARLPAARHELQCDGASSRVWVEPALAASLVYLLDAAHSRVCEASALPEVYVRVSGLLAEAGLHVQKWSGRAAEGVRAAGAEWGVEHAEEWEAALAGVAEARRGLDLHETEARFGPVVLDHAKVQAWVALRLQARHNELVQRCARPPRGGRGGTSCGR